MGKQIRHILLASPALILGGAAAHAADLPANLAQPVQYVRVCDAYGSGFFTIPGTDTCLRVGGYVRVQAQYSLPNNIYSAATGRVTQIPESQDTTGLEVRGRIFVDSRTQTQWGTVQTYARLRATNSDGLRATSAPNNFATSYPAAGNKSSTLTMERAYIRFAGITAGLQDETFNTAPGPDYYFLSNTAAGFANGVKALKYTAVLPGGITWENAIESRGDFAFDNAGTNLLPPSAVPTYVNSTYVNRDITGYNFVSTITDTQKWGHVALSGAVGENTPWTAYSPLSGPTTRTFSYAIGPEIDILLPQIAKGDEFYANFAYGYGLLGEVTGSSLNGLSSDPAIKRGIGGIIRQDANMTVTNVSATGVPLAYGTNVGYEAEVSYTHYWAPQWRSNFGLNYVRIVPAHAFANGVGAGLNTQLGAGNLYTAETNIIWSPTKAFDIGVDVIYGHLDSRIQNPSLSYVAAGEPGLHENTFVGALRFQRGF